MNWTNEKPSKPGWYWLRYDEDGTAHIVELVYSRFGPRLVFNSTKAFVDKMIHSQWAGPIPEPTDDKCGTCGGEGGIDSGGMTPWGSGINIPCPSCSPQPHYVDPAVGMDLNEGLK